MNEIFPGKKKTVHQAYRGTFTNRVYTVRKSFRERACKYCLGLIEPGRLHWVFEESWRYHINCLEKTDARLFRK